MSCQIGFLGAGQMASALARGFVTSKLATADQIVLSDVYEPCLKALNAEGFRTTPHNLEVVRSCNVIVLAVKPNTVAQVLGVKEMQDAFGENKEKVLVSICAGTTIDQLEKLLSTEPGSNVVGTPIIRVMPNTPCLVGAAASVFCPNRYVNDERISFVEKMLSSVGICYRVPEYQMDIVTALSGSGPAYVFQMIDAMACAGVRGGLPRNIAQGLAAQTVYGAAKMVIETGKHPCQLRDDVSSPGGTTIAGLYELNRLGFPTAVMGCVDAAMHKSVELSHPTCGEHGSK